MTVLCLLDKLVRTPRSTPRRVYRLGCTGAVYHILRSARQIRNMSYNRFAKKKSVRKLSQGVRHLCVSKASPLESSQKIRERTFIMVKPDGVQRGLISKVLKRFEQKGFKLVAMKMCQPEGDHGPVCVMVWEGQNAVRTGMKMLGEIDPSKSAPGTIRGDLGITVGKNICQGSESVESAHKEITHWFKKEELCSWGKVQDPWVYE